MGFTPFAQFLPLTGGTVTGSLTVTGSVNAGSSPGGPLWELVGATPAAGFALQNATPNILTLTSPNDGNNHRYKLVCNWHVTTAETGGACTLTYHAEDGSTGVSTFKAGGQGAGDFLPNGPQEFVTGPNQTVTVAQSSALTVGATQLWAELWGS